MSEFTRVIESITNAIDGLARRIRRLEVQAFTLGGGGSGGSPGAHAATHQNGGADEISVAGLSGELADIQKVEFRDEGVSQGNAKTLNVTGAGGSVSVAGSVATLNITGGGAPAAHASTHQNGGSDEISVLGLSGLLADAQTPLAHASSHQQGGSDPIKLDDLATPDDNTDLNASITRHGLLPKLSGDSDDALRGDGTWGAVTGGLPVSVTKETLQIRKVLYDDTKASAGTWDVSGIDQSYDHLEIRITGKNDTSAALVKMWFNNDTTVTNYRTERLNHGAATTLIEYDDSFVGVVPGPTNTPGDTENGIKIDIFKYTGTSKHKQSLSYGGDRRQTTEAYGVLIAHWWENTAAINRIGFVCNAGQFAAGSRLQIIGIKNMDIVTDVENASGSASSFVLVAANNSLADYKNIADFVCDGVDDQDEILDAIDLIKVAGGTVFFAPGTYYISATITVRNHGVRFAGLGGRRNRNNAAASQLGGGVVLLADTGLTGAILDFRLAGDTAQLNGCTVENMTIDGNNNLGSNIDGIFWNVWRGDINQVDIWEMSGNGLRIREFGDAIGDNYITSCQFGYCSAAGLFLDSQSSDNHFLGCIFNDNQDGIRQTSASNQFTSIHTFNNTRYNYYGTGGLINTRFVNWKCEQAGQHGILFQADGTNGPANVTIVNLESRGHSTAADNTYSHIKLDGAGTGNLFRIAIIGATFSKNVLVTEDTQYLLDLDSRCYDCRFEGWVWADNSYQTAALNIGSSHRTIFNNWSTNAGNPASAGDWNGVDGQQGLMLRDTSGGVTHAWINGSWITI